jgi:hypothetical protein
MKKYFCLCGEGSKTLGKLNHHIHVRSSRDGKGKHKRIAGPVLSPLVPASQNLDELEKRLVDLAEQRTAKVVKEPVASVKEVKPKPKTSGRRWWLVLLGLVLIIVGGAVSYYGNSKTQSALIVAGLLGIVPGGYLVFQGFKKREPELPAVDVAGKEVATKPTGKENCLNIYPREKGGIRFEYMNKPPFGLTQQCINNGKKYFVNIWKPEDNQLVPLIFQDQKYEDPRVLAEVVEADPVRRYFEISIPLLEKIAPWAFVAAIGLALLAIIILPGVLKG